MSDEAGDGYMLTIAAGGDAYFTAQTDMKEAVRYLDYVQLMAYDLQGGFRKRPGTMRPSISAAGTCRMPSADKAVRLFMEAGCLRQKIVLGIPFTPENGRM